MAQIIECGNCGRSHEVDDEEVKNLTAKIECLCGAKGHILRQDLNHGWFWNCPQNPKIKPGIYCVKNGENISLNPPKTPLCPVYNKMNNRLHNLMRSSAEYDPGKMLSNMVEHKLSCLECRKRMLEFNELAKVAKEPEAKDE